MDVNIIRGKASLTLAGSAYTGTLSVGDSSWIDGGIYYFKPGSNSPDGATVSINGFGAKNLVKNGGIRINVDDLQINVWYECIYNSTLDVVHVLGLPNVITALYDFSVHGGAGPYIQLTSSSIPIGISLIQNQSWIAPLTNLTSAGNAFVLIYTIVGGDLLDQERPYNDEAYTVSSNITTLLNSTLQGSIEITGGAAGSVDTISVNGINILNGVVPYNTSIFQTVSDVCDNINSNPVGNIKATKSRQFIHLYSTDIQKHKNSIVMPVSATSTTLTIGGYHDIGTLATNNPIIKIINNNDSIGIFIAVANLTGGKFKIHIPYIYT